MKVPYCPHPGSTVDVQLYHDSGVRRHASDSASTSVRESALLLGPNGWPEGFYQAFAPASGGGFTSNFTLFEVVTAIFKGIHGELDWLIVAGQDINCEPGQIWNAGGCTQCAPGTSPNTRGDRCLPCPAGTYSDVHIGGECGLCPDGTHPNERQTACTACPAGAAGVGGLCRECARSQVTDQRRHLLPGQWV
jgi:hypothetical protein